MIEKNFRGAEKGARIAGGMRKTNRTKEDKFAGGMWEESGQQHKGRTRIVRQL